MADMSDEDVVNYLLGLDNKTYGLVDPTTGTPPFAPPSWSDVLKGLGSVLGGTSSLGKLGSVLGAGGIYSLLNNAMGGSGTATAGYRGGIPAYTASRTQTPFAEQRPTSTVTTDKGTTTVPYRPGQGGITYFNPIQYTYLGKDLVTPIAGAPAPAPAPAPTPAPTPDQGGGGGMAAGGDVDLRSQIAAEFARYDAPQGYAEGGYPIDDPIENLINRNAHGRYREPDVPVGTGPVPVISTGGGKARLPEPLPISEDGYGYEPWLPGGGGKPMPGFEGDRGPSIEDLFRPVAPPQPQPLPLPIMDQVPIPSRPVEPPIQERPIIDRRPDDTGLLPPEQRQAFLDSLTPEQRRAWFTAMPHYFDEYRFPVGESMYDPNKPLPEPITEVTPRPVEPPTPLPIMDQVPIPSRPVEPPMPLPIMDQVPPIYRQPDDRGFLPPEQRLAFLNSLSAQERAAFLAAHPNYLAGVIPPKMAQGGIASLPRGRFLRGPGDGVSDSIPAKFIKSGQPARLADGEFVVDARTVSELGNGSSEAGARKLYEMMDRVHKARRKAKRGEPSGADKFLPK